MRMLEVHLVDLVHLQFSLQHQVLILQDRDCLLMTIKFLPQLIVLLLQLANLHDIVLTIRHFLTQLLHKSSKKKRLFEVVSLTRVSHARNSLSAHRTLASS
jgi:hypothetical protein